MKIYIDCKDAELLVDDLCEEKCMDDECFDCNFIHVEDVMCALCDSANEALDDFRSKNVTYAEELIALSVLEKTLNLFEGKINELLDLYTCCECCE